MSAPTRKPSRLSVVPDAPAERPRTRKTPPPKLSRDAPKGGRSEMAEALAAMPDEYIVCREDRHHWVPFTARPAAKKHYERIRRCDQCTSTKWTLLNSRFEVVEERPIDYPPGYLLQGLGRLTGEDRWVVRGINFMREMKQDDSTNPRSV